MQIKSARIKSYNSFKVNETTITLVAKNRLDLLKKYWLLKAKNCHNATIFAVINTSRATIFRWQAAYRKQGLAGLNPGSKVPHNKRKPQWGRQIKRQVLLLRRRFPLWAKKTIATILKRDHALYISESTVGRIIKKLIMLGKIKPVCFYFGKLKLKRTRQFRHHAKRCKKGMKAKCLGALLQIDHMIVSILPGFTVKHFEDVL